MPDAMPSAGDPPVFVVARRADRLGGRLGAMVNALTLARLLGVEFRFVWPRGRFLELDDPTEILSAAFIHAHEMDEDSFGRAQQITGVEARTLADLRQAARPADRPST